MLTCQSRTEHYYPSKVCAQVNLALEPCIAHHPKTQVPHDMKPDRLRSHTQSIAHINVKRRGPTLSGSNSPHNHSSHCSASSENKPGSAGPQTVSKACSKSAHTSSKPSTPVLYRTRLSLIPSSARFSGPWSQYDTTVGCSMRDSTPPKDGAM